MEIEAWTTAGRLEVKKATPTKKCRSTRAAWPLTPLFSEVAGHGSTVQLHWIWKYTGVNVEKRARVPFGMVAVTRSTTASRARLM